MFYFRRQIENLYSEQVIQRRKKYTQDENDLIKRFLSAAKEEPTQGLSLNVHKLKGYVPEEEKGQTGNYNRNLTDGIHRCWLLSTSYHP